MLALLSVSDKRGLIPFARSLTEAGWQLVSTGGTHSALSEAGIPCRPVSDLTGSKEILGGRVKTLHPKIHGGILARLEVRSDVEELDQAGIQPIDLVVVNLYPFVQAASAGASEREAIEQIDVGGPAMVRAAAKNVGRVTVVVDPDDYPAVAGFLRGGQVPIEVRRRLMGKAFAHTAAYDAAIAAYFHPASEGFPLELTLGYQRVLELRYGENPHQRAAFYRAPIPPPGASLAHARVLQGKELSYNNLLDLDAALSAVIDFERPCAVIVKHNTPCGVACADDLVSAYRSARAADETSAFGGVVALNRPVDRATAEALTQTFIEAVIAPQYAADCRGVLGAKKALRVLELDRPIADPGPAWQVRSTLGGLLVQERDGIVPKEEWKVVTARAPSGDQLEALKFAWKVCKHVKSNGIVFSDRDKVIALGGGQTSRVDSVRSAVARGGQRLLGSVLASDAFFPFRDGLDLAAQAGAVAVVQPGGSVRDPEVIAAADGHQIAMVFTGVRHFRH